MIASSEAQRPPARPHRWPGNAAPAPERRTRSPRPTRGEREARWARSGVMGRRRKGHTPIGARPAAAVHPQNPQKTPSFPACLAPGVAPSRPPVSAGTKPAPGLHPECRPMGTLYLVRHGQASFGAADYDRLSELGERQSERLGRYWAERGLRFDAVITGTLRRHAQTWAGIARGRRAGPVTPRMARARRIRQRRGDPRHPAVPARGLAGRPAQPRGLQGALPDAARRLAAVDGRHHQPRRHARVQRVRARRDQRAGARARPPRGPERADGLQRWADLDGGRSCAGPESGTRPST